MFHYRDIYGGWLVAKPDHHMSLTSATSSWWPPTEPYLQAWLLEGKAVAGQGN